MNWIELKQLVNDKVSSLSEEYQERLKFEFKEIEKQGAEDYWLDLVKTGKKFEKNKNGLVLPWLMGITDIDPIIGENKIFVGDETGKTMIGLVIKTDDGKTIEVSEDTIISTKRGLVKGANLVVGDEICIFERKYNV